MSRKCLKCLKEFKSSSGNRICTKCTTENKKVVNLPTNVKGQRRKKPIVEDNED